MTRTVLLTAVALLLHGLALAQDPPAPADENVHVTARTQNDLVRTVRLTDQESGAAIARVMVTDTAPGTVGSGGSAADEEAFTLVNGTLELSVASWRRCQHWIVADGYAPLFLEFAPGGLMPSELTALERSSPNTLDPKQAPEVEPKAGPPELPTLEARLTRTTSILIRAAGAPETRSVVLVLEARDFAPTRDTISDSELARRTIRRLPDDSSLDEFGEALWRFEDVPSGSYVEIELLDGDKVLRTERIRGVSAGSTLTHTVDMSTNCSIAGVYLAEDGTPRAGRRIRLGDSVLASDGISSWKYHLTCHLATRETVTDAQGQFAFESMAPGEYSVWAASDDPSWSTTALQTHGHPAQIRDVAEASKLARIVLPDRVTEVSPDRPTVKLVLRDSFARYIGGTLLDVDGLPTTGRVLALGEDGEWLASGRAAFRSGAFLVGPLPEGEYRLYVVSADRRGSIPAGTYATGDLSLRLVVPGTAPKDGMDGGWWTFAGTIHVAGPGSGVPKGTTIRAVSSYSRMAMNGLHGVHYAEPPTPIETPVSSDGKFELPLLPHTRITLEVHSPEHARVRLELSTGEPGQGIRDFVVTLRKEIELEVLVSGAERIDRLRAFANQRPDTATAQPTPLDLTWHTLPGTVTVNEDRPGTYHVTGVPGGITIHLMAFDATNVLIGRKTLLGGRLVDAESEPVQFAIDD